MFMKVLALLLTIVVVLIAVLAFGTTNWAGHKMGQQELAEKLNKILQGRVNQKNVFGAVVRIESGDGSFAWEAGAGTMEASSQYLAASITKMYTTAAILKLRESGRLRLEDKISLYLPQDILAGLHVYKGTDYSQELTIRQLLFQTSGLPDVSEEGVGNNKGFLAKAIDEDLGYTFEEMLAATKELQPHFKPGQKGKAYYADVNFDLLGHIIESITQKSLDDAYKEFILNPLSLRHTYLYQSSASHPPIHYNSEPLQRPLLLSSAGASGGIVTNAQEQMVFLKAFFRGEIFPKEYLDELYVWNSLGFQKGGLEYGGGLMRSKLLPVVNWFYPNAELIGHSGSTNSFAFYSPAKDLYITGTLNQVNNPSLCFPFMVGLLHRFDPVNISFLVGAMLTACTALLVVRNRLKRKNVVQ